MPELPEIVLRAQECDRLLTGRRIVGVQVWQPKCLNLFPEQLAARVMEQTIAGARYRGKWVDIRLTDEHLLLNLGMGGEIALHAVGEALPDKLQALFALDDGTHLSLHFWWFGYIHLASDAALGEHAMTASLGADPLAPAFTPTALGEMLAGSRTRLKTILLDQEKIAGIGNMYAHDILFRARLHPLRPANSLTREEVVALHGAIRETFALSLGLGGSRWEKGLTGEAGGFGMQHYLVGYREGQPCPVCNTAIEKIKTGSTSSFICPICQEIP